MIRIGDTINDRYKVENVLGHGGMSDVFGAYDTILNQKVAIKIIKEECLNKPESIIRFENEARFSSALNHPNIVKIFNYSEYKNLPFIVNEYIKGRTLKEYLDVKKSFSVKETCHIMLELCDALMYIHNKGIIHRDIKPQNIFYDSNGEVKLADFGISFLLNSNLNVNENKRVMGTAEYMAPEIIRGKSPSSQSDVYALGVTFYELITGCVPFDGETPSIIAKMQINEDMPSPKKIIPSTPNEVCNVIIKATSKDLETRYKNAGEMKEDLLLIYNNKKITNKGVSLFKKIFG